MNLQTIDEQTLKIKDLRHDDRQKDIKVLSNMIYSYLKENNYNLIDRKTFKTFFISLDSDTTINRLMNEIILILIKENKILISEKYNNCIRLLRDTLKSKDSYIGSRFNGCVVVNNKSIRKSNDKYKVLAYNVL